MSLTACIRKAAKAISPEDGQYLSQVRAEFMEQGLDAKEADRRAVQSLLDLNETEMRGLSTQIEEKGGKPLFDPPPPPPIAEQPIQFQRKPQMPARAPLSALPDDQFESTFESVFTGTPEARDSFNVVSTFDQLPEVVRNQANRAGNAREITAAYHNGQVYIVKDKMRSKRALEEAMFHEATHGGIAKVFESEGVSTAMNRLWDSMGRQTGFDKLVKELGIENEISPYRAEDGSISEEMRAAVLVEEMIAVVGEKGSKGLKLKIQELIGAIRKWLRDNGFARLANMSASDIAALARRSRDIFMQGSRSETESDSVVFSEVVRRNTDPTDYTRPYTGNDYTEAEYVVGLYSNAEKVVIDQGDKIFKPSKKNPEGAVRGDQIYAFLKSRGLKKDEDHLSQIEQKFTEDPAKRFTKQETLEFLRSAPLIEEYESSAEKQENTGLDFYEGEIDDDYANWEHYYDEMVEAIRGGNPAKVDLDVWYLETAMDKLDAELTSRYPQGRISENLLMFEVDLDALINIIGGRTPVDSYEEALTTYGKNRIYAGLYNLYPYELNLLFDDVAKEIYMDNPYMIYELRSGASAINDDATIVGNEDVGFIVKVQGEHIADDGIYDLNEAKVRLQNYLEYEGYIDSEYDDGDTRYLGYLQLDDENFEKYREIRLHLPENPDGDYTGGHFGGDNLLLHALVTDRSELNGYGYGEEAWFENVLAIEEMQSDWHSDIRKAGGVRDQAAHDKAVADLDAQLKREQDATNAFEEQQLLIAEKNVQEFTRLGDLLTPDGMTADPERRSLDARTEMMPYNLQYPELPYSTVLGYIVRNNHAINTFLDKYTDYSAETIDDMILANWTSAIYFEQALDHILDKALEDGKNGFDDGDYEYYKRNTDFYRQYNWNSWYTNRDLNAALSDEYKAELDEYWRREREYKENGRLKSELMDRVRSLRMAPPNVPFQDDRYISLALKRLLVKAVDEGKSHIAIPSGDRVQARWSDSYDYSAIYDRKMRSAMRKLTGQEGEAVNLNYYMQEGQKRDFTVFEIDEDLRREIQEQGLPMFQRRSEFFQSPEEGFADRFLRTFQDKFIGVKRLQEKIAEHRGVELRPEDNPYTMEQFMSGKIEEDYKKIDREYVKPLVQLMSQKDIDIDMLDVYLIARHAPERNAYIASINDQLPDGGSGMTNQQAQTWMQEFRAQGKLPALAEASKIIDSMISDTRTLMRTAGLIDEPTERMLEEKFEHYVPLKGISEDEEGATRPRTGSGFEIRGGEFKRAMGRTTMPESPTAHALQGLFEKVIRSRKNEVGQTFLELVEQNPNPAYWEVFTQENPDTTRQMTTKDGKDKVNNEAKLNYHSPLEYFTVKRDGVEHYIKLKDPVMFDTMKNLGSEPLSKFMTGIAVGTRIQAMLNTSLNPNFVLVNPVRDVQTAIFNMLGEQSKAGGKIEGLEIIYDTVVKDLKNAVPAIYQYERNMDADPNYKVPNNLQKDYQEFLDMGAKTGFFDSPDIATIQRQLHTAFNLAGKDATMSSARAFRELLRWVETANIAMENGVRLAAYKNARDQKYKQLVEQGDSPEQAMETAKVVAADLAKNLTVNFNRKGEQGSRLNALYMFLNASVQGTKQLADSLGGYGLTKDGKKKMTDAQKLVAAMMFAGFANALFNRMTMGEDEDEVDKWDKVPSYVRERNFVINLDWMGYEDRQVTIPLPYGYNVFYNIGDAMEALVNSDSSVRQASAFTDLARSAVNSFSPVGYHGGDSLDSSVMLTVMPTLATPLAEIGYNTNYFGGPIYPEQRGYGPQMNQANTHFRTTKEPYKAMAKFLSDRTEGGVYIQGGIDVYPDTIEHIVEAYGGGLYRAVTQAGEVVSATAEQRSLAPNNIPFARSFFREQTYYEDVSLFYDRAEYLAELNKEHKEAEDAEKFRLKQKYGDLIGKPLLNAAERTRKMLAELRDKRDKIQADETLSERERDLQLEEIEDRVKDKVDSFNLRYNKAEG